MYIRTCSKLSDKGGSTVLVENRVRRNPSYYRLWENIVYTHYKCSGCIRAFINISTVCSLAGVAGLVDQLSVQALSRSSLSVKWLCPEAVGTFDPILLHYRVQYCSTPSNNMSEITVRASESTDDVGNCVVMTSVPGLEEGTSYSVRVQAMAGGNLGQGPVMMAEGATFGQGESS